MACTMNSTPLPTATPISKSRPALSGPISMGQVVESEDSNRVTVGVAHVIVADPVVACAIEHHGTHTVNLP